MLEDFDVFARHVVVHEREDGLIRLRVVRLSDGVSHHVEFPEPTYEVDDEANAEFDTDRYRFRYQSLVTPSARSRCSSAPRSSAATIRRAIAASAFTRRRRTAPALPSRS